MSPRTLNTILNILNTARQELSSCRYIQPQYKMEREENEYIGTILDQLSEIVNRIKKDLEAMK